MKPLILLPLLICGGLFGVQSHANTLFEQHCAACHGASGHGDGPAADQLRTAPADLTQIAARRDGVWPMLEIMAIIDGYARATEPREDMPVLEPFQHGPMIEFDTGNGVATPTPANLVEIVEYLETLQDPAPTQFVP